MSHMHLNRVDSDLSHRTRHLTHLQVAEPGRIFAKYTFAGTTYIKDYDFRDAEPGLDNIPFQDHAHRVVRDVTTSRFHGGSNPEVPYMRHQHMIISMNIYSNNPITFPENQINYPYFPVWPANEAQESLIPTIRVAPSTEMEQKVRWDKILLHMLGDPVHSTHWPAQGDQLIYPSTTGEILHILRLLTLSEDDKEKRAARLWLAYCYNLILIAHNPANISNPSRWEHIRDATEDIHHAHGEHHDFGSHLDEFMLVYDYSNAATVNALIGKMYNEKNVYLWNSSDFDLVRSTDSTNPVTPTDTTIPLTGRASDHRHVRDILGMAPDKKIRDATLKTLKLLNADTNTGIRLFSGDNRNYNTINLPNTVRNVRFDIAPTNPLATWTLTGNLHVDDVINIFSILVTSEDGETTETYTVRVIRQN